MYRSQAIKLVLLGGGALALTACLSRGCHRDEEIEPAPAGLDTDPQWYDASGNPIPEQYTGDEEGRMVPFGEPHDRFGRPLQFDEFGERILLPVVVGAAVGAATRGSASSNSYYRRTGGWLPWLGSSYRSSPSYGPSRPSGTASGGSTYFGGSRPGGFGAGAAASS